MQLGMASALETLCGQAYGAKQYHMLGIYLQRSWLVLIGSTYHLPHAHLHFCWSYPLSPRSRRTPCPYSSSHSPMGHRHQLLLRAFLHLPNVPPGSEQEQDHCLCRCYLLRGSRFLVLATNGSFRLWDRWCNDLIARSTLVA